MANSRRLAAAHVGRVVPRDRDKRACDRCGFETHTNSRTDWSKTYLCGPCKAVDPQFGSRPLR